MKITWAASAPGRVEPLGGEVRVTAQMPGRIAEVLVAVNDKVLAGDLLVRLDDEELLARVHSATAEVAIRKRDRDNGGLYYAKADGSKIVEVAYPVSGPNGCGLSPDGKTFYAVELEPSRLWAYEILSPGVVRKIKFPHSLNGGRLLCGLPGFQGFDSLAVDSAGRICIGTIWDKPQITVISPKGEVVREVPMPEAIPTNICFGGPNYETAFVTLSGTGKLVSMKWDVPGLPLSYEI
jgi:gluconolactonase